MPGGERGEAPGAGPGVPDAGPASVALAGEGQNVPAVCQRYGCLSREVTFYLSAMGSYVIRDTILRGVQSYYDEAHEEVFAALDYLRNQGH